MDQIRAASYISAAYTNNAVDASTFTSTFASCIVIILPSAIGCASVYSGVASASEEMTMNLAFKTEDNQEYATRTELHYMLHVPYAAIARAIRDGKLALHLIDGKIQINIDEAKFVLGKRKSDLFA